MKFLSTLAILLFTSFMLFSQEMSDEDKLYIPLVEAGEEALINMKYDSCMIYYKDAFKIRQTSVLSTLRNAACAFSVNDESYFQQQFKKAFDISWGNSKSIFENYPEFEYLKGTRFEKMIKETYLQYAEEAGVNLEMMAEFENIRFEDQRYRKEMRGVEEKYGWESPQIDSLWTLQNAADSINTARITELIDEMGYPGKSVVGEGLASTAFLVIQHADSEVQQKYLPIITKAADDGEVSWRSVALLVDRVNLGLGKNQIYGSQVYRDKDTEQFYFGRIEQPYKVDSIRASVGLGPLQNYAQNWDFDWNPERHLKINDEMDAKKKAEEEEEKK